MQIRDEYGIKPSVFIPALILAVILVIVGIIGLSYWNARVTCNHWQNDLNMPTRLDVWGPGCVAQLEDGREIPVHQIHVERGV